MVDLYGLTRTRANFLSYTVQMKTYGLVAAPGMDLAHPGILSSTDRFGQDIDGSSILDLKSADFSGGF